MRFATAATILLLHTIVLPVVEAHFRQSAQQRYQIDPSETEHVVAFEKKGLPNHNYLVEGKDELRRKEGQFPDSLAPVMRLGEAVMTHLVMKPEFFEQSSRHCLKRFYDQLVDRTTVKQSTIPSAGRGVFAAKNIPKGTVVGLYPVHKLMCEDEHSGLQAQIISKRKRRGNEGISKNPEDNDHTYFNKSKYVIGELSEGVRPSLLDIMNEDHNHLSLYVDSNPNLNIVKGWIAHLINDGATAKHATYEEMLRYWTVSKARQNCFLLPLGPSPILAAVTKRKIRQGEELFVSYGDSYWQPYFDENTLSQSQKKVLSSLRLDDATDSKFASNRMSRKYDQISVAMKLGVKNAVEDWFEKRFPKMLE